MAIFLSVSMKYFSSENHGIFCVRNAWSRLQCGESSIFMSKSNQCLTMQYYRRRWIWLHTKQYWRWTYTLHHCTMHNCMLYNPHTVIFCSLYSIFHTWRPNCMTHNDMDMEIRCCSIRSPWSDLNRCEHGNCISFMGLIRFLWRLEMQFSVMTKAHKYQRYNIGWLQFGKYAVRKLICGFYYDFYWWELREESSKW